MKIPKWLKTCNDCNGIFGTHDFVTHTLVEFEEYESRLTTLEQKESGKDTTV